jgi:nicotinamidase-related amidase
MDKTPALVVIDLQKGIVALPTAHPMNEIVAHTSRLANVFRRHDLPVVLVNATGRAPGRTEVSPPASIQMSPDWTELVEELEAQSHDYRVTKQRWGAFHETDLDQILRTRGATQVVIAGVATSAGVESTARSAYEHGYHVVLAVDAMTDMHADAHRHSVERIFPRIGETATTEEIIAMLERTR